MGFFNFNQLKNNNLQCIPVYSGEDGGIFDGCLYGVSLLFINTSSRLSVMDRNLTCTNKVSQPGTNLCTNGSRIFVCGNNLLYYSDDGGNTWSSSVTVGGSTVQAMKANGQTVVASRTAAGTSEDRVSLDGGLTWADTVGLSLMTTSHNSKGVLKYARSGRWYRVGLRSGGGGGGQVGYSSNGLNWQTVFFAGIETSGGFTAVEEFAGKIYLGGSVTGNIYRCNRDFSAFEQVASASSSPFSSNVNNVVNFCVYNNQLYAFASGTDFSCYKLVDNAFELIPSNYVAVGSNGNRFALEFNGKLIANGGQNLYTTMIDR
jgi:hypothetical protein